MENKCVGEKKKKWRKTTNIKSGTQDSACLPLEKLLAPFFKMREWMFGALRERITACKRGRPAFGACAREPVSLPVRVRDLNYGCVRSKQGPPVGRHTPPPGLLTPITHCHVANNFRKQRSGGEEREEGGR